MNHLIKELFIKMKSDNERIRSNAITDISFILEMNSWQLTLEEKISRYERLIGEELVKLTLTEDEEAEIVKLLQEEVLNSNKSNSSLLFTIGQASPKIGLLPLLQIIQNCSYKFNSNESYQVLVSLERLLLWDDNGSDDNNLSEMDKRIIISQNNPIPFIKSNLDWALNNPNSPYSSELQYTAERLLACLSRLIE